MSGRRIWWALALGAMLAGLTACLPGDGRLDEEKDPHFQRGRNLVNGQDFKGAVDEFEKALETNPHSAAAHFELGWLYDTKLNDYAAAIYHYQKHLQLEPDSPHAASVQDRIRGCKQELANSDFILPNSQNLQREVDRLNGDNLVLRRQLDELRAQLASATAFQVRPSAPPAPARSQPAPAPPSLQPAIPAPLAAPLPAAAATAPSARPRAYVIQDRDSISAIARRYGLKTSMVLAANPGVDPRRLRVGQTLNLP